MKRGRDIIPSSTSIHFRPTVFHIAFQLLQHGNLSSNIATSSVSILVFMLMNVLDYCLRNRSGSITLRSIVSWRE